MPSTRNYFSYVVQAGENLSERKIMVINGIPFYSSTGTSEDREEIISATWRKNIWMPIAGVDTSSGKEGHLCKLGSLFKRQEREFESQLTEILTTVFISLPADLATPILPSLLQEKYNTASYLENIDNKMILNALAGQLTRFGSLEAILISMAISPEAWSTNKLLEAFMAHMNATFPSLRFSVPFNPSLILHKQVVVDTDNIGALKNASIQINDWLLQETNQNNKFIASIFIGVGVSLGIASGFILGLSTAGVGLLLCAAVLLVAGFYNLWQNQDDTRWHINNFLKNNSSLTATTNAAEGPQGGRLRLFGSEPILLPDTTVNNEHSLAT
jgi:hypothetical protein